MGVRIADVDCERITPLLLKQGNEPALDLSESIFPAHIQPLVAPAQHGLSNAVWVGVQFLETVGFRTDIALAEDILTISPDGDNFATPRFDLSSTGCFAKGTGGVADFCSSHFILLSVLFFLLFILYPIVEKMSYQKEIEGRKEPILRYICTGACPIAHISTTSKRFSNATRGARTGPNCTRELPVSWQRSIRAGMNSGACGPRSILEECFLTVTCATCLMLVGQCHPVLPALCRIQVKEKIYE